MKNYIEKNKIENNINEKELEKAYDLFCDYMIKCYGYCPINYYGFKKFVIDMSKKKKNNERGK